MAGRTFFRCLATVCVCVGVAAHGDPAAVLSRAIAKFPGEAAERCDYRYRMVSSEEPDQVVRYDADASTFQLLSLDGVPPTDDERDDFEPPRNSRHPAAMGPEDFDQGFTFEAEENGLLRFAFVPLDEESKKPIDDAVRGALWIDPAVEEVRRMEIRTTEPFAPALMVKLKTFEQAFSFAYQPALRGMAVERMRFRVQGRALAFKKLDVNAEMVFDQFDCPAS